MKRHFNILVVGKGLVGSAAAKYLSLEDNNIAILGPDEPENYNESIVFGSHYDQARVQRIIGKGEIWTKLNYDSAQQYETIQKQSGIHFHEPAGCLYVNPYGQDNYLKKAAAISTIFNQTAKRYYSAEEISNDFNDFNFPTESNGLYEYSPSGFINPRLLIKAQLNILEQNNGVAINETVTGVSFSHNMFSVTTYEKNIYTSAKILIATGSFINFLDLVPQKLDLQSKSEVVLLVKVSQEEAQSLSRLPSLLYEINNSETEGMYLIRPVQYPDGAYYLKMGCNMPDDIYFENLGEVQHWFREADSSQFASPLLHALKTILPGLPIAEYFTKKCIISRTSHGRPYIGESSQKGLYIAGGCNGYSAMCSDAIGNVAADLIINATIPEGFPVDAFELHYQNQNK